MNLNNSRSGRRQLRELAWRLAPAQMSERARAYERNLRIVGGVGTIAKDFINEFGPCVLTGPCQGMDYSSLPLTEIDAPVAKLLGSYERELHLPLQRVLADTPTTIIDIGCAEGYYAVGLAKALPAATVFAFDLASSARHLCTILSRANGVDERLVIMSEATANRLMKLPLENAFILSDCEGAEDKLFSPQVAASLHSASLIIEVHTKSNRTMEALKARFSETHSCEVIGANYPRNSASFQFPKNFDEEARMLALSEGRLNAEWLVLRPVRRLEPLGTA